MSRTVFALSVALFAFGSVVALLSCTTSEEVSEGGVATGAYISGAPWDPAKIDDFTEMVGTPPAIVHWYQDWAHSGVKEFDPAKMDAVVSRGAMPMLSWEPRDYTQGTTQPEYALETIIAGDHDDYIRQFAQDSAAWGRPYYLRFAHEMNGDWYPWGAGVEGNEPADYIAAWKHVHDIFAEEEATNVRWVWSPNVGQQPPRNFYPGDAYVDWVGIDGYNQGTTQSWSRWQTFTGVFGPTYGDLAALTGKPMMIAETGSTESGGDKAAWISSAYLDEIPNRFPRIKAIVWFDEDKEADWRIDSSQASLDAYRAAVTDPRYQGTLP